MIFVYFYAKYKKNNIETARVEHLHNPYCIRIIKLTRGYSSSRCRPLIEFIQIFRIMQLFSLDILTRSNTLKLFPFLLFLPGFFLLQLLNNHVIIDYQMMIILRYLPLYIPVISLVRICHS